MDRQDNNLNELFIVEDEPSRSAPPSSQGNDESAEEYIGCMPLKDEPSRTAPKKTRSSSSSAGSKRNRPTATTAASSSQSAAAASINQGIVQLLRDEPSRATPAKTRSDESSEKHQNDLTSLKDISRNPPRKTKSATMGKSRRRELRQQIEESVLQNMQISLDAKIQSNETIRQLTSSPNSITSSKSRSSTRSGGSGTTRERRRLSSELAAPPLSNDDDDCSRASLSSKTSMSSKASERRYRRTRSSVSTATSSSVMSDDKSVVSSAPSMAEATVASAKTTSSDSKVQTMKKKRSKSKSKQKRSSSVTSSRRRRRDKGDSLPMKPRKAPPSPTEDTEKASTTPIISERKVPASRWNSDDTQPSEPSTVVSTSVKRDRGRTSAIKVSGTKPSRSNSDPYMGHAIVMTGPAPPLDTEAPSRSEPREGRSKTTADDKQPSDGKQVRGRMFKVPNISKSIKKAVRRASQSPGPHNRRRRAGERSSPDDGLPNPETFKFWDDRTTSTASTRTMSTMSTDLSDQSTLSGGSYDGNQIVSAGDETEGIDHLLGRLRTDFDKPSDEHHHKPSSSSDLADHLAINKGDQASRSGSATSSVASEDASTVASGTEQAVSPASSSRRKRPKGTTKKKRITRHSSAPLSLTGKKKVGFGSVSVREYERCIGDNPAVSSGPPIGLGWYYRHPDPVDLEFYEAHIRKPGPRTRKDFFLTPQKRFHILLDEWGFSVQDICRAKDQASEIRYQRQVSVFGDSVVPQLNSRSVSKKGQSYSSSKKGSKLTKLPRSQDRWNASCPAAPVPVGNQ